MNEVIRAAAELQAVCEAKRWRFCFIKGLALQRWGEPRETGKLDWSYIRSQLRPLAELKGAPELWDELEARRIRFEA